MARKNGGTPRKSTTSGKSAATQSSPVTPIRETTGVTTGNGAVQLDPRIQEEIRVRAYELYLERGGEDGFHQQDWSRAEKEILSKHHIQREKSA